MAKEDKKPTVSDVVAAAKKKYDLRIGSLSDISEDVAAFTTGNLAIDHILGVGGIPEGRSTELFGPPSSGKTTTAIQCAAELQKVIKAGGNLDPDKGPIVHARDKILYADYEHALDPVYVAALGLDLNHDSVLFMQPDTLEDGVNVSRELIKTGDVRLSIFDSVAAMTPSAKLEAEVGKSLPAIQAKLMSDFLVTLNALLHEQHCSAIFLNHIMELMEMNRRPGMPPRKSTPGGRALKYYASLRVEYQQIQNIKGKVLDVLSNEEIERVLATNVKVTVVKNKVAPPAKSAVVRVRYGKGFDNFWTALQILVAHKEIVYSSGILYFDRVPGLIHSDMTVQSTGSHRPYIKGEESLFDFADRHLDWRALVIDSARKIVEGDRKGVLDSIIHQAPVVVDDDDPPVVFDDPEEPPKPGIGGIQIVDPLDDL